LQRRGEGKRNRSETQVYATKGRALRKRNMKLKEFLFLFVMILKDNCLIKVKITAMCQVNIAYR
jgi:hypothetical protein